MSQNMIYVLLIDDNQSEARLIQEMLAAVEPYEFNLERVDRASAGLEALAKGKFDVVLSALHLPDTDELEIVDKVCAVAPNVPLVVMLGTDEEMSRGLEARRRGAQDYVVKGRLDGHLLSRAILDAIERKHAEAVLKQSEASFKSFFDNSQDGILIADRETKRFVMWNRSICTMLGYTEEEMKNLSVNDIHRQKDLAHNLKQFERLSHGEIRTVVNVLVKRKDGSLFYADISASVVSLFGKPCLMGSFRDITERKQMEDEIHLQSEIIANMSEGVLLIRVSDGEIVYANPKFETLFGYNPGELNGEHVSIVHAPVLQDPKVTAAEMMKILGKTGEWHGDVNHIKKDGTTFWCHANVSFMDHSTYGRVLVSVHTDITARKQTDDALKHSEGNFRAIFNLANDAIVIRDIHTYRIVDANVRACSLFGCSKKEMTGVGLEILAADSAEYTFEKLKPYYDRAEKGEPQFFEWFAKDKCGGEFWVENNLKRAMIGGQYRFLESLRDITERKSIQDELNEKIQDLERFSEFAVDRELRMEELEKKIKALEEFQKRG